MLVGIADVAFVVAGLALVVLGALRIVYEFAGRPQRVAQLTDATRIADALLGSAALGFVAAFLWITSWPRIVPPGSFASGFWMGLCAPVFVVVALWRLAVLPRWPMLGMALGVAAALVIFRIVFGPAAGFGHELGHGVGVEVGEALAVACGLLGAFVGLLATQLRGPLQRLAAVAGARLSYGMLTGLGIGVVLAMVGTDLGIVRFPYVAEIMYISDTSTLRGWVLGVAYGVVLLGIIGALLGGLAVLYSGSLGGAGRQLDSLAVAIRLALALAAGLLCGLAVGFESRFFGGPLVPNLPPYDPVAGLRGLDVGLIVGVSAALILALAALLYPRFAGRLPDWARSVAGGLALILPGLLALTLPLWFVPLVAVNAY